VYQWDFSGWTQLGADIDGRHSNKQSGWSVSLSSDGHTVAVANGCYPCHGSVYTWDESAWAQVGGDFDGSIAVALSTNSSTVAIGSPWDTNNNGDSFGVARVFSLPTGQPVISTTSPTTSSPSKTPSTAPLSSQLYEWVQVGDGIDGEFPGDISGFSTSLSADGNTLAIGAPYNDGNGVDSGHVRVYAFDGTTWNQVGADIDGEMSGDFSGLSVSLSSDGSTLAIGAPNNNDSGSYSGHVRVFMNTPSTASTTPSKSPSNSPF
jgi:hypothetical protein